MHGLAIYYEFLTYLICIIFLHTLGIVKAEFIKLGSNGSFICLKGFRGNFCSKIILRKIFYSHNVDTYDIQKKN